MTAKTFIFGGASIGDQFASLESVEKLLDCLQSLGITRIDVAGKYPPCAPGYAERLLGQAKAAERGFEIDTKIFCETDGKGSLSEYAIEQSLLNSLKSLQTEKVNILYCHRTDPITPLEEQAASLDVQFKKGRFNQLGISNFPPDILSSFIRICQENDYVLPSVYQGQYNILCRIDEETLFPLLREHQMCYIAYSPLAGSALTNPSLENKRFGLSVLYTLHPSILDAISRLAGVLESESPTLTLPACALRWLTHHSQLDWGVGDGIILGASHTGQIVDNVGAVMEGTLKTRALGAVEILWKEIAHVILASRKTTHELPEGAMSVAIRVWQEGS